MFKLNLLLVSSHLTANCEEGANGPNIFTELEERQGEYKGTVHFSREAEIDVQSFEYFMNFRQTNWNQTR